MIQKYHFRESIIIKIFLDHLINEANALIQ
jgi:hypothetical protein